ncbi:MAG TPA: GNAT family N-acetyltransferase [Sphingomonas sp.]
MSATVQGLPFRIGARTLASIPRRLRRVALSLDQSIEGAAPELPALVPGEHGYILTSLPDDALAGLTARGMIAQVRQRYARYWTDLGIGHDAWLAGLSGNARSALKRKRKKLEQHTDGMSILRYRSPAELAEFHALARPLAELTYQERLMGEGLPDDAGFLRDMYRLAGEDRVRAWLLLLGERPVAYLWCSADGATLRYDYVGHDPAFAELSPGTVLHAAAFADLFAEGRFRRFDFTEGEGQHKRQFATAGVACADLLLLRATWPNRAALAALRAWDGAVAATKRVATHPALGVAVKRLRRA